MKKLIISLGLILAILSLVACNQEKISNDIKIDISKSTKFSKDEINEAIDCVKNNFSFPASTLTKIWYDEEKSNYLVETYLKNGQGSVNGVSPENVIILLSNFDVDGSGDNPVLEPNSTYTDYQWVLKRDNETSAWEIDDCGY